MSRSVAIFFGSVTILITLVLFFRSLDVDDKLKTSIGKIVDKIPRVILAIVSVISACLALYYLTMNMLKSGPDLLGLIYIFILMGAAMADMYLSDVLQQGRQ